MNKYAINNKTHVVKNCPFCGNEAVVTHNLATTNIKCSSCPAEMRATLGEPVEHLIQKWNLRISK